MTDSIARQILRAEQSPPGFIASLLAPLAPIAKPLRFCGGVVVDYVLPVYARLIDAANAPIFGIDVEGSVNVWNQCAIRLTGFDAGDVMGKHLVNEFITDDYKASVQGVFTKALEGRETANFEFPLVTNRVETKTSAPHAIDAVSSPERVCSMARRWTKALALIELPWLTG